MICSRAFQIVPIMVPALPQQPVPGFAPGLPVRPPKKKGSSAPVVILLLLALAGGGVYYLADSGDKNKAKDAEPQAPLPSASIIPTGADKTPALRPKPRPVAVTPRKPEKSTIKAAPEPEKRDPNEWRNPNVNLPAPKLPAGTVNWLFTDGNTPKQSASPEGMDAYGPEHAVDGDTKDTDKVAAAGPEKGKAAWWSCSLKESKPVSHVVIYGGGEESKPGKLTRFRVELVLDYPQKPTLTRTFLKDGFALEGSEVWELKKPYKVKSVKVISLSKEAPLVIREIQLFGPRP